MRTIQHIMLATDGAEAADRALDVAAPIIKAIGGELSILTVGEQPSGDELRRLVRSEGDIGDALESLSNRILKQANDRARRLGAPRMSTAFLRAKSRVISLSKRRKKSSW